MRAAEESKSQRRGVGLASSDVGCGSSLLQPQVCSQAPHTASPPQDSRRPFLLLTQVPYTGVVSVPYPSRGLTSSGEHVLYVCRERTIKTQGHKAVSMDGEGPANCPSGWWDSGAQAGDKTRHGWKWRTPVLLRCVSPVA